MKALCFDGTRLRFRANVPTPKPPSGWALLRVLLAGICRTDLEITRGYMNFRGVPGHEFVGVVEACEDATWIGRRVVGEINAACGKCDWCLGDMGRHCPDRAVLGILNLDGAMADYCMLPAANLRPVPEALSDEQAVFTEPLSAACEILDQVSFSGFERCIVLGDGKLGILCVWVLATVAGEVTLVGRHEHKLAAAAWRGLRTARSGEELSGGPGSVEGFAEASADVVVDATGSVEGLREALRLCRPRGTLVLKTTVAAPYAADLAPLVVNEISVVGSRCGLFEHGLAGLLREGYPVERLITARYPLERGEEAFARAAQPGSLKVLLQMG